MSNEIIHFDEAGTSWRPLGTSDQSLLTKTALTIGGKPRNQVKGAPEPHDPLTHEARRTIDGWVLRARSQEEVEALTEQAKVTLRAKVAAKRWEVETGGIEVQTKSGKVKLDTDPVSQGKLTALLVISSMQPVSVGWKGKDGKFAPADNQDVQAMATAAFSHVQACFAREAELVALIDDGKLADVDAALPAFWG